MGEVTSVIHCITLEEFMPQSGTPDAGKSNIAVQKGRGVQKEEENPGWKTGALMMV